MKTIKDYGIRLVANHAEINFTSDKKRTDYTMILQYDRFKLVGQFESVCVHGFWIANAMCMN